MNYSTGGNNKNKEEVSIRGGGVLRIDIEVSGNVHFKVFLIRVYKE
jgi:hypothetical protein